jgi:hypothetical protein
MYPARHRTVSEPFVVTAAERLGGLGEQRAKIDPADTRHVSVVRVFETTSWVN